ARESRSRANRAVGGRGPYRKRIDEHGLTYWTDSEGRSTLGQPGGDRQPSLIWSDASNEQSDRTKGRDLLRGATAQAGQEAGERAGGAGTDRVGTGHRDI